MNNSFADSTKEKLCSNIPKKQCCKGALLSGILLFSTKTKAGTTRFISANGNIVSLVERLLLEVSGITSEIDYQAGGYRIEFLNNPDNYIMQYKHLGGVFDCKDCASCFLRGIFLVKGTVNAPDKERHLEIYIGSKSATDSISDIISECISPPKTVERKGKYSLYFKDTDSICDFLNLIGASSAAFDIINAQIEGNIRSDTIRKVNCETANIKKTTLAASAQCAVIENLMESGRFKQMPDELRTTASLRLENRLLSISELAALHDPPLTKSGLNHRLRKIMEFASEN